MNYERVKQMAIEAMEGKLGLMEGRLLDFAQSDKQVDKASIARYQELKNALHVLRNSSPLDPLKEALQLDEDFAWTWHCNVAMAFIDACPEATHRQANEAAANFMMTAFNVNVRKTDNWRVVVGSGCDEVKAK